MRVAIAAAAVAGSLVGTRVEASPSARLVYSRSQTATSCPSDGELRSAVAARFGYDPFFLYAPQTIVVQVARDRDEFTARVELVDADGIVRGTRGLSSQRGTCGELFEAMALAISIALDASAAESERAPETQPLSPPPSAEAPPPHRDAPLQTSPPVNATRPTREGSPPRLTPPAPATFFAGASVRGAVGLAPSFAAGGDIFLGVRYRALSLALEGFADAPASSGAKGGGGRVESWLGGGIVVPCVHVAFAFGCGLAALGAIEASGLDVTQPRSSSAPFVAVGARLGVELSISPAWAFHVEADLLVDLNRPRLILDDTEMWSFPIIAGGVGTGLTARFR